MPSPPKALRTTVLAGVIAVLACLACFACGGPQLVAPRGPGGADAKADDVLERVSSIHGSAGPWAVAGYRMGTYAVSKLGLPPQSFDLEVIHHTPGEVQFSCIADGAAAATGASIGKLNLRLVDATETAVSTTYRRKSTGQSLVLRPTAAFVERFRNVPPADLAAAGRTVLSLPDSAIFEEVEPAP